MLGTSQFDPMAKFVCGIESTHNRVTQLNATKF